MSLEYKKENWLPIVLRAVADLIKKTTIIDPAIHGIGKILSRIGSWANLNYATILDAAAKLAEEEEKLLEALIQESSKKTWFGLSSKWTSWSLIPVPTISIPFINSPANEPEDEKQISAGEARLSSLLRFVRSLRFMLLAWGQQCHIDPRRSAVLLSVLRNFPLLPIGGSEESNWDHHYEKIQQANIPTLVIWGSDDRLFPAATFYENLQKILFHASFVIVDRGDHAPFLDQPKKVWEEMKNFLTKQ
jgi:pimeloyl-ACP methyl ester carboxylesterase